MTITSNKRLVSYACLAAFAVLLVLTLLFTTVGFTEGGIDSDNGFTWLTFETNFMEGSDTWEYGGVALGIISIAQLIIGLAALAIVANAYMKGKAASEVKIFGLGFTSLILYTIEGIAVMLIFGGEVGSYLSDYLTTYAYIPLIIGIVLTVAYTMIQKKMPGEESAKEAKTATPAAASKATPELTEEERIEALAKYKDLLEKGILTQEEFDAKKNQLLGL